MPEQDRQPADAEPTGPIGRFRRKGPRKPREAGTRALLDSLLEGDPQQSLKLGELLAGLGRRTFGMLLLIASLPSFIPIPGSGAVSGPLVVLVSLQLLVGMRKPWLPAFIANRGPRRQALERFERVIAPWLARLEKLVKPRLPEVLDRRLPTLVTALLVLAVGILLSLPIPFTNYILGGLVLAYALALLERDGALMLVTWVLSVVVVATTSALSRQLIIAAQALSERLF